MVHRPNEIAQGIAFLVHCASAFTSKKVPVFECCVNLINHWGPYLRQYRAQADRHKSRLALLQPQIALAAIILIHLSTEGSLYKFHFQLGLRNTQITAKRFRSNFANKPYTLPLCRHFLEYTCHTWHLAVRGEKAQSWRATECAISFPEPAFPLQESAGWHSLKCEQVFGRASFILFFVCWFVFWYTIKASK